MNERQLEVTDDEARGCWMLLRLPFLILMILVAILSRCY